MTMRLMPVEANNWFDPSDPMTTTLDSGIVLNYPKHLEGGCFWLKDEFVNVLTEITNGSYENCLEWCAGLGGIGFEILGKRICKKITFTDYYHLAIENCLENARRNNLQESVSGYISPTIKDLPETDLYDLVIGTPPHCFDGDEYLEQLKRSNIEKTGSSSASNWARLTIDDGMEIHKEFFNNIECRLTDHADVLIFGSGKQNNIKDLAFNGNLELIDTFPVKRYGVIYYFKKVKL